MNVLVNTKHRTDATEIMDDFSIRGDILRDTLNKLAIINKWLGGNKVTINGLKKILKNHPKDKPLTVIDLGCGGGDVLRNISEFGKKNSYEFKLIGIDANKEAIVYAKELSKGYNNINYQYCDIFSEEFKGLEYDIALGTLFMHHFKDDELVTLLSHLFQKASLGIVINDLHRHKLAYYLFKLLSITIKNKMIIEDGLTSVLRGFKRSELEQLSNKLKVKSQIQWKWAFRFLWVIQK